MKAHKKGFGFIQPLNTDSPKWVFFHKSVVHGGVFYGLKEGQAVIYAVDKADNKGRAKAFAVALDPDTYQAVAVSKKPQMLRGYCDEVELLQKGLRYKEKERLNQMKYDTRYLQPVNRDLNLSRVDRGTRFPKVTDENAVTNRVKNPKTTEQGEVADQTENGNKSSSSRGGNVIVKFWDRVRPQSKLREDYHE